MCKAEGLYLHVFYFICMTLISGWVVSGFSAGSPLNETAFCLEIRDIFMQTDIAWSLPSPLDVCMGYASLRGAKPRGTVISGDWRGPDQQYEAHAVSRLSCKDLKWYPAPCLCCRGPGKRQWEPEREQSSSTSSHPAHRDCSSLVLSSAKYHRNT